MSSLGVSDCALVRFLQRGAELDVETLRESLARSLDRAHEAAREIGAENYLVKANGLLFVVRSDTVVTVLEDNHPYAAAAAFQYAEELAR